MLIVAVGALSLAWMKRPVVLLVILLVIEVKYFESFFLGVVIGKLSGLGGMKGVMEW